MWIICDCEDGAYLYFGAKEQLSPELFRSSILDGSITDYLNKVPVKKGDTIGHVHIYLNEQEVGVIPIKASASVDKLTYFTCLIRLLKGLFTL